MGKKSTNSSRSHKGPCQQVQTSSDNSTSRPESSSSSDSIRHRPESTWRSSSLSSDERYNRNIRQRFSEKLKARQIYMEKKKKEKQKKRIARRAALALCANSHWDWAPATFATLIRLADITSSPRENPGKQQQEHHSCDASGESETEHLRRRSPGKHRKHKRVNPRSSSSRLPQQYLSPVHKRSTTRERLLHKRKAQECSSQDLKLLKRELREVELERDKKLRETQARRLKGQSEPANLQHEGEEINGSMFGGRTICYVPRLNYPTICVYGRQDRSMNFVASPRHVLKPEVNVYGKQHECNKEENRGRSDLHELNKQHDAPIRDPRILHATRSQESAYTLYYGAHHPRGCAPTPIVTQKSRKEPEQVSEAGPQKEVFKKPHSPRPLRDSSKSHLVAQSRSHFRSCGKAFGQCDRMKHGQQHHRPATIKPPERRLMSTEWRGTDDASLKLSIAEGTVPLRLCGQRGGCSSFRPQGETIKIAVQSLNLYDRKPRFPIKRVVTYTDSNPIKEQHTTQAVTAQDSTAAAVSTAVSTATNVARARGTTDAFTMKGSVGLPYSIAVSAKNSEPRMAMTQIESMKVAKEKPLINPAVKKRLKTGAGEFGFIHDCKRDTLTKVVKKPKTGSNENTGKIPDIRYKTIDWQLEEGELLDEEMLEVNPEDVKGAVDVDRAPLLNSRMAHQENLKQVLRSAELAEAPEQACNQIKVKNKNSQTVMSNNATVFPVTDPVDKKKLAKQ